MIKHQATPQERAEHDAAFASLIALHTKIQSMINHQGND
jgi:hypothetical protein